MKNEQYAARKIFLRALPLCLLLPFFSLNVSAQFFDMDQFGKNRVQYQQFEWRYVSTSNFDIYYYDKGFEIARLAAKLAEANFGEITDMVGFAPYNRPKIFIYNSIFDLQQSNIGVKYQGYEVGGQTRFVRSEIEIAYTGDNSTFQQELRYGIADVLIFEMMYGGNLKEILQSNYLLNLPEWFMAGAARYIAYGWSLEMDDFMRDMLLNRKLRKPESYSGEDAHIIGHAIWNFMAEEYGRANVASVLNLTRIVRNEEVSINNTLGINYDTFLEKWENFYRGHVNAIESELALPSEETVLVKTKQGTQLNELAYSPDGLYFAYVENTNGRYQVIVEETRNGKSKIVFRGGYKVINQEVDYQVPLIQWKNSRELAVLAPKKGQLYLWIHDIDKKGVRYRLFGRKKQVFGSYDQIKGFDISSNGRQILLSAAKNGENNLYIYDLGRRRTQQITSDVYDDLDPIFLPGSTDIIFSSNRIIDSVNVETEELPQEKIAERFNLYHYKADSGQIVQLTNTLSHDRKPKIAEGTNKIYYLSDQQGVQQLHKFDMEDNISMQVSNFQQNIQDFSLYKNDLLFTSRYKGNLQIYSFPDYAVDEPKFTGKTFRQQVIDFRKLLQIKEKRAKEKAQSEKEEAAKAKEEEAEKEEKEIVNEDDLVIDTDNYQFDTFESNGGNKRKSFLERYKSRMKNRSEDEPVKISRPQAYESRFATDNFVTSLRIDPLRGWGLMFEVALTDVLENHKVNAGLFGLTNLNNSNFFAEYEFLKHRLDFGARYERHNLAINYSSFDSDIYNMNHAEFSVSYPFNITTRLKFAPFYAGTRHVSISPSSLALSDPDNTIDYFGFSAEFVFDNSIVLGLNMMEGTRVKVSFDQYYGTSTSGRNFGNFMLDARHYYPIYKSFVLATRFSYGAFTGQRKKQYRLGGMYNWLLPSFAEDPTEREAGVAPPNTPDMTDLLFTRFVTSMRGFDLNNWNGNNFMLFNAELRLPVLKLLHKGTITSNFFRNLQLIAFTDVGSAWTGLSPFNEENALNTEIVPSGGFTAVVKNFKDPFLVGYGFGARTMMLGYYTKIDFAWGIEDRFRSDVRVYFTLGYDF